MARILPELWVPVGVNSLEPTAELVVRSERNTIVVAGPGAGKTELLAQRACFLLETGTCPATRRILAISFKRDAAKNLGERVRKRCGDRAQRFDSLTIDAFAKGLVDRFRLALDEGWRPKPSYEVLTRSLNINAMRDWIEAAGAPPGQTPVNVRQLSEGEVRRFFDRLCHGFPLPYEGEGVGPLVVYLGRRWWKEQLGLPAGQPSLTFPMLNRLSSFLLRCNPKLTLALRSTYAFVFLDEFQDTTAAQYDLIRTAFQNSRAVLTAVGDSKQRIMVWAGAMTDVFETYQNDFSGERHCLTSNYRSAPELVRMQHIIAQVLEAGTPPAKAAKTDATGSCVLLEFSNPEDEAVFLAGIIEKGILEEGKQPRDYCVLVRQRTREMISSLETTLSERKIKIRDESQLQDLLAEPVTTFLMSILRLATRPRDSEAWADLTNDIAMLYGLDLNEDGLIIERECKRLVQHSRVALENGRILPSLPQELIAMVGDAPFRSAYRQYRNGSYLHDMVGGLSGALKTSISTLTSARKAVDDVIGFDAVPAMTIHKSKGLEFHTVIFLGLEDSQWWAFANQADEEKRGFFVAFSRAAERVYFTFSNVRDERWGRRRQLKSRIGDLYSILLQAGVPTVNHRH